jgi:cGMP-dependent protein kinase
MLFKITGKGSFGFVQLVKYEGKTYALKGIAKSQVVQLGQQEHVMHEKDAMVKFHSDFCVKLYSTFKDRDALYFLLEPCLGGELFTLLRSKTSFNEKTAKFYAACVVMAFEHMHSFNTVYRDLKPENLLLDEHGYIKVTDFGFAKVVLDRTYTLCGTPDYLAPEVVSGQGLCSLSI